VFQLGIAKACARALVDDEAPTSFEDIIALVALYRPGPMANIPLFGAPQARLRSDRISCTEALSRSSPRPTASSSTRNR